MKTRRVYLAVAAVWAVGTGSTAVWAVGTPAYSVGSSSNGRLGAAGAVTAQWLPVPVVGIGNGTAIAAGYSHSLAVRADGTVWSWGANGSGQLGINNTTEQWLAVQVLGLTGVTDVAAGESWSLALKADGTVWAWGQNGSGQLGDNTTTQRNTPVQVLGGLSNVIAIAAGGYHGLAVLSNGTVRAWGSNGNGQLGDNTTTQRNTPITVLSLSSAIGVAGGGDHSMAVLSDGTVRCWGYNGYGQLGDNSTTQRNSPVPVQGGLSGVIAVASGGYDGQHSLALKSDGTVWAWGRNDNGQLGDNSTTQRITPVQVMGLTGTTAIATGRYHCLAIKTDSTAWGWGFNGSGRIGDGTPVGRLTPVRVSGLLASSVSAGESHSLYLHAYDCNNPSPDCNGNGTHDGCDILTSASPDCNTNGVPDECDAGTTSLDCDGNIIPDECDNQTGNVTWTGGNNGNYSQSSNWSPAGPPRGLSQAYFSHSGASDNRSIISGDIGACSVVIQASGSGKQILQVNEDQTYYTGNGITINAGGELNLLGGSVSGGPVVNNSNTISGYGLIDANLINTGLITIANLKDMDFTGAAFDNQSGGEILAYAGSRTLISSPDVTQAGDVEIRSGAVFATAQPLTNAAGGQITLYGGTLNSDGLDNAAGADLTCFGTIDTTTVNNGNMVTLSYTQVVGDLTNNGTIVNLAGVLTIIGAFTNNGVFIDQPGGRDASSGFTVTEDARFGPAATLRVFDGTIVVSDDLDFAIDDSGRFELAGATVQLGGLPADGVQTFEVMAEDRGRYATLPDASLYSLGRLRVGPTPTTVQLVNQRSAGGAAREALYVDHLVLERGVTLDLNGQALYYNRSTPSNPFAANSGVRIIDSVGTGLLCRISPARGEGDLDGDCAVTTGDVSAFVAVLLGLDNDAARLIAADVNLDGQANGLDVSPFVTRLVE